MPPRGTITKKRRQATLIYSAAVEANPPGTTHEKLHEWVVERAPKWLKDFGWIAPDSQSRASDYIREIMLARAWLDDAWHVGIFAAHGASDRDIPADAMPDVMAVAIRCFAGGKRLTARQAYWVARLRHLLLAIADGTDENVQLAYEWSLAYSARERAGAAFSGATGVQEPLIPSGHESDTWPLDVVLAATGRLSRVLWETLTLGAVLRSGLLDHPIWPDRESPVEADPITDTEATLPFRRMLLKVTPEVATHWRTMSTALLQLRARAEEDQWEAMTHDEREEEARTIGKTVMMATEQSRKDYGDGS